MKNLVLESAIADLLSMYKCSQMIDIDSFSIYSDKLPKSFDKFRILQVSDFHCRRFTDGNKLLYREIEMVSPNLVLFTGDMIDRTSRDFTPFYELCEKTAAMFPTYYVPGNHELDLSEGQLAKVFTRVLESGVHPIINDNVSISHKSDVISLFGLCMPLRFYKKNESYLLHDEFTVDDMTRLLPQRSSDVFTLLMAHDPSRFAVYAKWGADLTFSGHVHGGVVRIAGRGILSPERKLFPVYQDGMHTLRGRRMVVSRGIGGFRLKNNPALNVVTLHCK